VGDKMIRKKRFGLTAQEKVERQARRNNLIQQKEKILLHDPWQGYCDNTDHPLFTIKVTKEKPYAACYYCSKLWILTTFSK
jgi:hypothetical protein